MHYLLTLFPDKLLNACLVISVDDSFNLAADMVKDGVAAVTTASPDSLIIDSHPQSEMDTSCLEVNSERNESDSVGHEIANSMMTLLLPRALPLLSTYTRKKKNVKNSPEISGRNSQDKNKKIDTSGKLLPVTFKFQLIIAALIEQFLSFYLDHCLFEDLS